MMNRLRSKGIVIGTLVALVLSLFSWASPPSQMVFAQDQGDNNGWCGDLDVVFVLDKTKSMRGAIDDIKEGIGNLVDEIEEATTAGDVSYQMGLVTFDNGVQVVNDLAAGNADEVADNIQDIENINSNGYPEASDEALNTVINGLDEADREPGQQSGDFDGIWRPEAKKVIVLVTDAEPGGLDDSYSEEDKQHAEAMADAAAANDITILPIFVPTGFSDEDLVRPIMENYADTTGGAFKETNADGSGTLVAIRDILAECPVEPDPCGVGETIVTPFVDGPSSIFNRTVNSYSGRVSITVSGTGEASGRRVSDAFYFVDTQQPVGDRYGLAINGQPARNFIVGNVIPVYNKHNTYTFQINAPGGRLTFGVEDGLLIDNSGSYNIVVCAPQPEGRFDVWMKDHALDDGTEPHGHPVWYSPDIKVCHSSRECAQTTNPVYGYDQNYVFVNLRNNGPNTMPPEPEATGSLYLYYIKSGGAAGWIPGAPDEGPINSWNLIGVEHNITIPYTSTSEPVRQVRFHWETDNMPGTGHYCLLARWVSDGDPMTYPETPHTSLNAQKNNNIAWRNINVVKPTPGMRFSTDFTLRAVGAGIPANLVIRPERPFPGTIRVNLGAMANQRTFEVRTIEEPEPVDPGEPGDPGEPEPEPTVEPTPTPEPPVDPGTGIVIPPEGRELTNLLPTTEGDEITLTFTIDEDAEPGPINVDVIQMAELPGFDGPQDVGGVRFSFDILPADAPPVAAVPDVNLVDDGMELTWPHDLHHDEYEIWRSDRPQFVPEDDSADLVGTVTAERNNNGTEALRFVDEDVTSRDEQAYYIIRSKNAFGEADSEVVTKFRPPQETDD